jgi:hypothetical protein
LAEYFTNHGYVRRPSKDRLKEGYTQYKKGTEVRLVVPTRAELQKVRAALRQVGLEPGRPFVKHSRFVQPVYGAEALAWFRRIARSRR